MAAEQGIAQRSINSSSWLFMRRISGNIVRIVAVAILARQLSPAAFGLVALAQVISQFLVISQESGVGTFTIYDRKEGWEGRAHSAFWLNLAITTAQVALLGLSIPLVSLFYTSPELPPILLALIATFFVRNLSDIPEALVQRKLQFRPLVIRDTIFDLLSATLSVIMALTGWGVWSLVLPQLILEPFRLVIVLSIAKWRPNFHFGFAEWPVIGRYSAKLMGTSFLQQITNDGDTLLVGKVLGAYALGLYDLAWTLSNFVGQNVGSVVGAVTMPAFALVSHDAKRLQDAYLRVLRALGTFAFPLLCGMFILADDVIALLYGPNWAEAAILLRIFILFTMIRSVTSPTGVIFNVMGRPEIGLYYSLAFVPFYIVAIILGSNWGVTGVAIGVTVVRGVGALIWFAISLRLLQIPIWRGLIALAPVLLASLIMMGFVGLARLALGSFPLPIVVQIVALSLIGALIYAFTLFWLDRAAWNEALALIRNAVPFLRNKTARRSSTTSQSAAKIVVEEKVGIER